MADSSPFIDSLGAVKTVFDLMRTAIGLAKDTADLLPEGDKKEAVSQALAEVTSASKIAEAQIAQALGYELCRCKFPPTPMLQVGYRDERGTRNVHSVYECPLCKQNNAGGWKYHRQVP